MESIEPKKLSVLRILQILEKYSDCDHHLTQEQIIKYLESDYGLIIERKSIGSNISLLKEAGFDIKSTRAGSYLAERTFEESELRLLIDSVLSSKHITAKHSKELIEKLSTLASKHFRSHIKHVYSVGDWGKTANQSLFLNIELIDEAIERNKQIKFNYNKYGADKKLHKSATHIVSPYQMLLHTQRYFLMGVNEKWHNMGYYRIDHITDMEILEDTVRTDIRTIEGFESGIDYKDLALARPYMWTDKAEAVTFLCDEWVLDQVIEWFGFDVSISRAEERYKVTVRVSPQAMEYWAMQFLKSVEILTPTALREKIKNNIAETIKKYN